MAFHVSFTKRGSIYKKSCVNVTFSQPDLFPEALHFLSQGKQTQQTIHVLTQWLMVAEAKEL
jgi:hypothetical protein